MEELTKEEEKRRAHYRKMTQTPIPKLVSGLAVPTIISMLTSSLYNMADTFFVSQLGTSAAGAVGIVFSLMAIIQAIGFTLGMGAGTLVSLHLGAKEQEEATCAASTGFFSAIALGGLLALSGTLLIDPLMRALGATETILPYARAYGQYILLAAPIMCSSFVMNNIFRQEGKAAMGMLGITTGGLLNIALDPVFIFALKLGTAGGSQPDRQLLHFTFSVLDGQKQCAAAHYLRVPPGKTVRRDSLERVPVPVPAGAGQYFQRVLKCQRGALRRRGRGGHEHCGTDHVLYVFRHAGAGTGVPACGGL